MRRPQDIGHVVLVDRAKRAIAARFELFLDRDTAQEWLKLARTSSPTMGATRDLLHQVLRRVPDFSCLGWECWGSICASEALSIMGQHYANGATPDDVQRWIAQYPMARYWWIFDHDY